MIVFSVDNRQIAFTPCGGHSASSMMVSSSSRVFASVTLPGPYTGRHLVLDVISYHLRDEYRRFIDSFKGE